MRPFLLDINVLIALADPAHVSSSRAHDWFAGQGRNGFATCPLTQNGVMRIAGSPRYPNSPGGPDVIARMLSALTQMPSHMFWPDDVSLLDPSRFEQDTLRTPAQLTDVYLLGLAASRGGLLATFDRSIRVDGVVSGASSLHLL